MQQSTPERAITKSAVEFPRLSGDVTTDPQTLYEHSFDWSAVQIIPQAVVYPRTVEDIRHLVDYVRENKSNDPALSITCRSAGTDVTGGPLNESLILDFMRYFTKLKIEQGYARVQPGVYYRDFDRETMRVRLFLPSAPESKDICALGGMIANNSGGQKTLRYGKTKDYVEELTVVLQDGSECVFSKISEPELEEKKRLNSFEGKIYREMHQLLVDNYDELQRAAPSVSKNSTGYNLWEVWDREKRTFDLSKVFVGSQGTLGIITEAKIRLIRPKEHAKVVSVFVPDSQCLPNVITRLLPIELESLELYDQSAIVLLTEHLPTLAAELGKVAIPTGLKFLPDLALLLKNRAQFILTAEVAEHTVEQVNEKIAKVKAVLSELEVDYHEVHSEREAEKYHAMRKASFPVLHGLDRLEPLTFIDDVVVDPARLGDFLPRLKEILNRNQVKHTFIGHIGNGNLHVITLMDLENPQIAEINDRITQEVNELVTEFGGSISGEHNDGRVRGPFLELMYGKRVVDCFRQTKQIFDPRGIFNPGNKVGADWSHTLEHLRTERPHNPRSDAGSGWRMTAAVLALAGAVAGLAYLLRRGKEGRARRGTGRCQRWVLSNILSALSVTKPS